MRELKFRYWDVRDKRMEYSGDLVGFWVHAMSADRPVMQYTGLKDKNGKEIYEDDILIDHLGQHLQVIFEAGCFLDGLLLNEIYLSSDTSEIIGNIHENPELLGSI